MGVWDGPLHGANDVPIQLQDRVAHVGRDTHFRRVEGGGGL